MPNQDDIEQADAMPARAIVCLSAVCARCSSGNITDEQHVLLLAASLVHKQDVVLPKA